MKLVILSLLIFLSSCAENKREFEEYDLPEGGAVLLTEYTHKHGFKETQCFYCHVKGNIHQDNTTSSPLIETARILTERDGIKSCSTCHGSNGL